MNNNSIERPPLPRWVWVLLIACIGLSILMILVSTVVQSQMLDIPLSDPRFLTSYVTILYLLATLGLFVVKLRIGWFLYFFFQCLELMKVVRNAMTAPEQLGFQYWFTLALVLCFALAVMILLLRRDVRAHFRIIKTQ